jgi:predicted dehydrogenase
MSGEAIPVGVVGVGHLGSRHARIYAGLPEAELVGVADIVAERARQVGQEYGAEAFTNISELVPRIRAASVAVPTVNHYEIALELMKAGIDVLVEKPMAATVEQAEEMVNAAMEKGRVLAVGHTERYNPAVRALLARAADPRFIEVHRLGAFTARSLDIDAVLDLMIHDLDVVAALVDSPVSSVEAIGVPVLTDKVDIANARLRFESGCVANFTASRISQTKVRKLRIWERQRYVSVDYLNQEALSYRLGKKEGPFPEIRCEDLTLDHEEPLKAELKDFLRAVWKQERPLVPGEDGLRALRLAKRVLEGMEL